MQNSNAGFGSANYLDTNPDQNDFDCLEQRFPTSEEKIPCEFCQKLLDFDSIILHQVKSTLKRAQFHITKSSPELL